MSSSFNDYQKVKQDVILYDNDKVAYHFDIELQGNVAYCKRSIVGTYETPPGKRYESFITDPQAFFELGKQGKLWFIPNSNEAPKKILINENFNTNKIVSRSYQGGEYTCYCEATNPGDCV